MQPRVPSQAPSSREGVTVNIQCENCAAEHDLDPPAWVLSSGRPFRFRCSVCGHSQMASPPTTIGLPDDAPTPGPVKQREASAPSAAEGTPVQASTTDDEAAPTPMPVSAPPSETSEGGTEAQGVFLKQDGKVYLVKDWATLQRWIMERRVGREDLVSDGGVRWEPIGSRAELGSFFAAVEQLEAAELAGLRGGDTPFPTEQGWNDSIVESSPASGLARLDDETEGVPMGLPPLPTEDLEPPDAGGEDYPDQPPSRLSAATPSPDEAPGPLDPTPSLPPPAADEASEVEAEESEPPAEDVEESEGSEAADPLDDEPLAMADEPSADDSDDMALFDDGEVDSIGDDGGFLSVEADTATDEAEDEPPFEEPNVELEEFGNFRPGDSVVDFADATVPSETADDPETESDDVSPADPTDEFDPEDPFRDFTDTTTSDDDDDEDLVVRRGPPRWLGVGAAIVVTLLAALALLWAYQNGYLGGEPPAADTGVATAVDEPVEPATVEPAIIELPVADDTDVSADTDLAGDTDAAVDTDAVADVPSDDPPAADPVSPPPADPQPAVAPTPKAEPPPKADPPPTSDPTPPPATSTSTARLKGRGWAAIDKGQIPDAIDTFKRATAQAPRDAEAQYGLGYAYLQANDKARAQVHLCRAMSLGRGNVDITRQVSGEISRQGMTCP